MTNGQWEAKMDAKADYEAEVLAEGADEFFRENLPELVSVHIEEIVKILIEEHPGYLERKLMEKGYIIQSPSAFREGKQR